MTIIYIGDIFQALKNPGASGRFLLDLPAGLPLVSPGVGLGEGLRRSFKPPPPFGRQTDWAKMSFEYGINKHFSSKCVCLCWGRGEGFGFLKKYYYFFSFFCCFFCCFFNRVRYSFSLSSLIEQRDTILIIRSTLPVSSLQKSYKLYCTRNTRK